MKVSGGWGRSKHRVRATRKPKFRWEVLGLQNPLDASRLTSIEDIRQQALSLASSELKPGTRLPTAERIANVVHAPNSSNKRRAHVDVFKKTK
jgi:hypothetical protein